MSGSQHKKTNNRLGAAITVRVLPRASRTEVAGILEDGTIKIRLSAPPVDGKANEVLIRFLADILEISVSKIEIVAGLSGKNKLITILDMDPNLVQERILIKLSKKHI